MARALHILSVGYDSSLISLRTKVLCSGGYHVEEAQCLQRALSLLDSDLIDLVVICHSVPEGDQRKFIAAARQKRRLLPIVCVTSLELACPVNGCSAVTNSPVELLRGVRAAVQPLAAQPG